MKTWLNAPTQWQEHENTLTVTTLPDTDFWQVTHYGFRRDSGHAYLESVRGDFDFTVTFSGQYRDLYDQAGLLLRVSETLWLKAGIEYVEDVHNLSVVVTREFSDWSVTPLQGALESTTLKLSRRKEAITIEGAINGGPLQLMRMLYFPEVEEVQIGPMCCSPTGQGFEVEFRDMHWHPVSGQQV
ncbi:DUF1349 domain-containing protein [Deinococcus cellulosilyticus]|uniref:DUF1349 domain-containing protein n=1 Tax=Deinococcus cellulosilyticus (strain DSM 18568 / NBRC 106333 / KACC 11606 / 5516J-15) TaxID=1223518 RepID=A0A511MX77_DEIC1|nr:DUF1349 domain-containing protein [Deinococcus cellulosilyticus]GEM44746.1 hypothetical protein DC3_03810 [Deinococcus cellulosilyticus NBRC 106333 = KACC 11606]